MSLVEQEPSAVRRFFEAVLERMPGRTGGDPLKRRRSLVSRQMETGIWFRRVVLKRKPVLHYVEVQLVDHCNLDCRGCDHFSNLCPPAFADLAQFETDLKHLANLFARITEIHLIGGEPLLHPQVTDFCLAARKAFPKSRIYLETNGMLLMQMSDEFWELLSKNRITLLCSRYPVDVPALEIDLLAKQRGVRVQWADLNADLVKIPIDPRGGFDAGASFSLCQGFNNKPLLRDGRLYPCSYIAFADLFRERFGIRGLQVYPTDWIGIRDEHSPEEVFEFLRNPVHWCSFCDMENRETYEWAVSDHHISEWTCAPKQGGPRP